MTELLIPIGICVVALGTIIYVIRTATEVKEEDTSKEVHQVRRITFVVNEPSDKPKKKKKKKPTIAESAPVAKRPVGRPRKTAE